ncbi:ATP-binding protein [Telmatospirillum sp. J64-1]|uniref:ATP-binding protein n=1 Tax=Telmatospirillum sp. J64-1 TaxID=2502183 RepID=UPI00115D19C3|nr:ATP-binding protein [Telmatospirillum sp. J64-1]
MRLVRRVASSFLLLFAWLCSENTALADAPPRAVAGILDLREWDFETQRSLPLRGEWEFHWQRWAADLPPDPGPSFLSLPRMWNGAVIDGQTLGGQGYGTFRLRVLLPGNMPPALGLLLPDINSAYRLFANDSLIDSRGQVGERRAESWPETVRSVVILPAAGPQLDLVLEVANYHHFEGGPGLALELGQPKDLAIGLERRRAVYWVALGAMLLIALFQLTFHLRIGRGSEFAPFLLLSLLAAMRTAMNGQLYVVFGDGFRADLWHLPGSYHPFFLFSGLYLLILRRLFPREIPSLAVTVAMVLSVGTSLFALIVPPETYTLLREPMQGVVFSSLLLGLVGLALAWHRGRVAALPVLLGTIALTAAALHDSLLYQRLLQGVDMVPLGFALFILGHAAALGLRHQRQVSSLSRSLEAANRDLEEKVTELGQLKNALEIEVRERSAALEKAKAANTQFLAMIGHEIRTPLHGWAGVTELLEATPLNEKQRRLVRLLRLTGEHLGGLMGNILDASRLEAGKMELDLVPFQLHDLVEGVAAVGRGRIEALGRPVRLLLRLSPGLPGKVVGDSGALRQVLFNLLDNAAKFTTQGHVRLEVSAKPEIEAGRRLVTFEVSDTGCGIPPEKQEDIFGAFVQVDASTRRLHGGSGLGLSICRRLVELMGGNIVLESSPGRGSRFIITLPLVVLDDQRPQPAPGQTHILVADDTELNRVVLREFLAERPITVQEASDGTQAVALAASENFDLILMDMRMPGIDGFEATRMIRDNERRHGRRPVPILALTAGASAEERAAARAAGVNDFIAKPVAREALFARLEPHLAAAHAALPADSPPPGLDPALAALFPRFLTEATADIVSLRRSLAAEDRHQLAELAHRLRGKAALFADPAMTVLLAQLESAAATASPADLADMLDQVEQKLAELTPAGA